MQISRQYFAFQQSENVHNVCFTALFVQRSCCCVYTDGREDKAKFEFTWNGMEIGSIDRSQFLINFAV